MLIERAGVPMVVTWETADVTTVDGAQDGEVSRAALPYLAKGFFEAFGQHAPAELALAYGRRAIAIALLRGEVPSHVSRLCPLLFKASTAGESRLSIEASASRAGGPLQAAATEERFFLRALRQETAALVRTLVGWRGWAGLPHDRLLAGWLREGCRTDVGGFRLLLSGRASAPGASQAFYPYVLAALLELVDTPAGVEEVRRFFEQLAQSNDIQVRRLAAVGLQRAAAKLTRLRMEEH
jgi:hypothetical protein